MGEQKFYRGLNSGNGSTYVEMPPHEPDLRAWNEKGWGIYWTVNEFDGPRQKKNLTRIRAWAIDMDIDKGFKTKEEQWAVIRDGLIPTYVVETKNGYHVYWAASFANPAHFRSIMLDRLIPFYRADKNAADVSRILRIPGYKHWKDVNNPFLVTKVHAARLVYSEDAICSYYPLSEEAEKREASLLRVEDDFSTSGLMIPEDMKSIWQKIWEMDCEVALTKLSGHVSVNYETFSFKQNSNGNKNIFVNGVGTSCFIDKEKRIGSLDGGGPTIYHWIKWYNKNPSLTFSYMKELFPDLWKNHTDLTPP
jgi:hypothetical protein